MRDEEEASSSFAGWKRKKRIKNFKTEAWWRRDLAGVHNVLLLRGVVAGGVRAGETHMNRDREDALGMGVVSGTGALLADERLHPRNVGWAGADVVFLIFAGTVGAHRAFVGQCPFLVVVVDPVPGRGFNDCLGGRVVNKVAEGSHGETHQHRVRHNGGTPPRLSTFRWVPSAAHVADRLATGSPGRERGSGGGADKSGLDHVSKALCLELVCVQTELGRQTVEIRGVAFGVAAHSGLDREGCAEKREETLPDALVA
jgi:hypothetical protein